MQQMLLMFNYLKRYHSDILDTLCIMLGFINLRIYAPEIIKELTSRIKKRKEMEIETNLALKNLLGNLYVKPNSNLNYIKITRSLNDMNPTSESIEMLINTITQKKTINKLYTYSTPMEINRLIVDILDLQEYDEIYNPCYGIGSLFLALAQKNKHFKIYGEELDSSLDRVARLILKAINIDSSHLFVNNILKQQIFPPNRKFNKIMCNPPIDTYIGILDLKNNERFAKYGIITKSVPELSFIVNGISYMKDKGVFIIRNQILKKSFVEERFKDKLCEEGLIEAIIELPSNIFPHNNAEFSLMILSNNNRGILHIDASYFFTKEGKYNRLTKSNEILSMLAHKKNTEHSKFTPYSDIDTSDLRAQIYLKKRESIASSAKKHCIKDIGAKILRGVRIYSTKESKAQKYLNIGIVNFNEYGFIDEHGIEQHIGDKDKIEQSKLQPYDILLSLRGINPKVTIIKESANLMIANAGIIVLRAKNKDDALGLFCYLFSKKVQNILRGLYWEAERKSIDLNALYDIEIPRDFTNGTKEKFAQIEKIGDEIARLHKELDKLR